MKFKLGKRFWKKVIYFRQSRLLRRADSHHGQIRMNCSSFDEETKVYRSDSADEKGVETLRVIFARHSCKGTAGSWDHFRE